MMRNTARNPRNWNSSSAESVRERPLQWLPKCNAVHGPIHLRSIPKLCEYFGLVFLFYSDGHDPMHLHVQHGDREGIIMLIMVEGELVELR